MLTSIVYTNAIIQWQYIRQSVEHTQPCCSLNIQRNRDVQCPSRTIMYMTGSIDTVARDEIHYVFSLNFRHSIILVYKSCTHSPCARVL
jgi:hypothetical protein